MCETHTACAIGHDLVNRGYSVLFIQAFQLVQRLLKARRKLEPGRYLRKLDRFAVVIVDDIADMGQGQYLTAVSQGAAQWAYKNRPEVLSAVRAIELIVS